MNTLLHQVVHQASATWLSAAAPLVAHGGGCGCLFAQGPGLLTTVAHLPLLCLEAPVALSLWLPYWLSWEFPLASHHEQHFLWNCTVKLPVPSWSATCEVILLLCPVLPPPACLPACMHACLPVELAAHGIPLAVSLCVLTGLSGLVQHLFSISSSGILRCCHGGGTGAAKETITIYVASAVVAAFLHIFSCHFIS